MAAGSGVDVRLMMPGIPDHKFAFMVAESYFGELLDHGVKIYRFTPGLLHGKTVLADREAAFVGSVNMDYRSFQLHFECGTLLYGAPALETLLEDMDGIMEKVPAGDPVRLGAPPPAAPGAGGPAAALRHVDVNIKKSPAFFDKKLQSAARIICSP
ncbi:MAG: phospholipase D-like domain-containing protein [Dysosmobacter sp.]